MSIRLACKVTKVLLMGREQTQKKPDKKEKKKQPGEYKSKNGRKKSTSVSLSPRLRKYISRSR